MLSSKQIKDIAAEARPIIERQLDDAEIIAGFRNMVADHGGDWSALKALLKAQIQDERDEAGDGKRVRKIVEKAEFASAYAGMLGLANMNEENFSSDEFDAETGEIKASEGNPTTPLATREAEESVVTNPSPVEVAQASTSTRGDGLTGPACDHDDDAADTKPVANFEPVAFLARERKPLRPHCKHPGDTCGGHGSTHCKPCLREAGVAA